MEDTINRIFDKLENADVSPSANYSMPEYYMHCAMRGREKEKRLLFRWLSMSLGIDVDLINKVFDERYNNVQNESRNMRCTIKLRESELKRMIDESVNNILMCEGMFGDMNQAARNGMLGQQAQNLARQGANRIQRQQSGGNMQNTGMQQQSQNNGNVVNQLKMIQQTINQILRQMGA